MISNSSGSGDMLKPALVFQHLGFGQEDQPLRERPVHQTRLRQQLCRQGRRPRLISHQPPAGSQSCRAPFPLLSSLTSICNSSWPIPAVQRAPSRTSPLFLSPSPAGPSLLRCEPVCILGTPHSSRRGGVCVTAAEKGSGVNGNADKRRLRGHDWGPRQQ